MNGFVSWLQYRWAVSFASSAPNKLQAKWDYLTRCGYDQTERKLRIVGDLWSKSPASFLLRCEAELRRGRREGWLTRDDGRALFKRLAQHWSDLYAEEHL